MLNWERGRVEERAKERKTIEIERKNWVEKLKTQENLFFYFFEI